MNVSKEKLKWFSIKQLSWLLQRQKKHPLIDFTKTLVWNLYYLKNGSVAYLFPQNYTGTFTSYLQTYHNVVSEVAYLTRSTTQNKIKPIPARTKVSENLFFLYCIKGWSKLDEKIRSIKSISKFKVTILNIIRLKGNFIFGIHDTHWN